MLLTGSVLLSCGANNRFKRELKRDFLKIQEEGQSFRGIIIYDPASEEVLFEHNSHKYFIPASNTKIFTFYAGLKLLEDSIPALRFEVRNDTFYFKGTGDPGFLHKNFDSGRILEFLKSRPEKLVFVSPEPSENALGPGWAWEDYNYAFSAERSGFPIYGNIVSFVYSPADPGLQVQPPYFQLLARMDSTTALKGVQREFLENSFSFSTSNTTAFKQEVPFIHSPELATQLLSDTLKKDVVLQKNLPENLIFKEVIHSHPSDSLYKKMLQESDNFIAEQLLLLAADAISDTLKAQKAISYMEEEYLKDLPDKIRWVDGSGLSRYNLFTPRSTVKLLEKIYLEVPQQRLFELLPAGGVSGTIKKDYAAPLGAPPFIHAKSGSLSSVHNLSGYLITAKGKILIFSYMNNNFLMPTAIIKAEMDSLLRNIYLNY